MKSDSSTGFDFKSFLAYFLKLGAFGFGGPVALAGYMEEQLVAERGWISKEEFAEGLALSQLTPGPMATQLAIYLGWVRFGVLGATLTGFVFVLPSFLIVLALSVLYVRYDGLPWMQGIFYGVGAAVIAIIVKSVIRLGSDIIEKDRVLWAIFVVSAALTFWVRTGIGWMLLVGGLINLIKIFPPSRFRRGTLVLVPAWLLTGLNGEATGKTLWDMWLFFAKAGLFLFGSGLGILPFLYEDVVHHFHWLTRHQFIDAVSVALVTPGPGVIAVAFIGYMAAGPLGALVASAGVFAPCYLIVVLLAPYYRRIIANPRVKAFIRGVVAAAIGAIAGSAVILGRRAIVDLPTVLIFLASFGILRFFRKIPDPVVLIVAAGIGLLLKEI